MMMKGARQNEYCRDREEFWYLCPLFVTHLGLLCIIYVVRRLISFLEVKKRLADFCQALFVSVWKLNNPDQYLPHAPGVHPLSNAPDCAEKCR